MRGYCPEGILDVERLDRNQARKLLSEVVRHGHVNIWRHCYQAARDDGLTSAHIEAVLTSGAIHDDAEFEKGAWRYRVHHRWLCVVIQFEDESTVSAVTVFDRSKRT